MKITLGYPLSISMIAKEMSGDKKYNKTLLNDVKLSLFQYFEEMIFFRFDLPTRRFLLELSPFKKFNTELAKMASGDSDAGNLISQLQKVTRMLKTDSNGDFYFWGIFREFLLWEQERNYTAEQGKALLSRGGLYYELLGNYVKALEFYSQSEELNKVSELIIKIIGLNPTIDSYDDLEPYLNSLPIDIIMQSPALMQGKSMVCALKGDYKNSEKWYERLKEFELGRSNSDAALKEARSRLVWLDISLPQRGVTKFTEIIYKAYQLISAREIKRMPFSVTSSLPSIINGGKDFSLWCKKDDHIYSTMKAPLEGLLGKDGVGVAECALAESKFEKGEIITDRILALVSKLNEIKTQGTPDIEFAIVGLLARTQVDLGKADEAKQTLTRLKEHFANDGYERFIENIDAALCRIAMRQKNNDYLDEWYRDKAPNNSINIKVVKRYLYITEAMAELSFGDNDAALLTLSPLVLYCEKCGRNIDMIQIKSLSAIARYRKKDKTWKDELSRALDISESFGFIRTIAFYGASILPLLEEIEKERPSRYIQKLIKAARTQAIYYPDFLKPQSSVVEKLTDAEQQVLRLVCADKSNSEIGEILNIQVATVKSHVSHILQKLDVKRRSEAKSTAERLHLV